MVVQNEKQKEKISQLKKDITRYKIQTVMALVVAVPFIFIAAKTFLESAGLGIFFILLDCVLFIMSIAWAGFRKAKEDELEAVQTGWNEYERCMKERDERRKWAEERYDELKQKELEEQEEEERRRLAAENMPCPICGSKNTKRISMVNRSVSVYTYGLASDKIGKQYECKNCKHKW